MHAEYACFERPPKAGESLQLKGQVQLILLQSKWLKKLIRATRDDVLLTAAKKSASLQ